MKRIILPAIAVLALACGAARAVVPSSIDLNFSGTQGGIGNTGFDAAYNPDPSGYTVGGGQLAMTTLPGDIYGDYEHDVNNAKNVFYSDLQADPAGSTVVEAKVTYNNLNQNYHGGGIWMGTDENHYIRLGTIWAGGVGAEVIRENMDLWPNLGGPGNDIDNKGAVPLTGVTQPLNVWLRLVRTGHSAQGFYSLDGVNYTQYRDRTFDAIAIGGDYAHESSNQFKVGAYAFGGGTSPATVTFHSFSARAVSAAIPEPGSMALLLAGVPSLLAFRRRKAA